MGCFILATMQFSNSTDNTGIVERARIIARVDSNQWPTSNIVNSANDRLDKIMNYGIKADRKFQLDDTNHTKLPIGTTDLTATQSDYSFLTDEQGNRIINITRVEVLDDEGIYSRLRVIDQQEVGGALGEFMKTDSAPIYYDKIADNIIRLYPAPETTVSAGLKFYFQRTPSYFVATDTTKQPGFANELHRGVVMQCAYDAAFTLGLENANELAIELAREDLVMTEYFNSRNTDEVKIVKSVVRSSR